MTSRTARAGTFINLRARFRDDIGEIVEGSNVYVHVFPPDEDTSDLQNALVVSGSPTYLGQGIWEYEYNVPSCGPGGTWADLWQGELTCQDLTAELAFTVVASGIIDSFDQQLWNNDLVEVTIASGIRDVSGLSHLEEPYEFEFMTTTSPSYTNLRKVRLEIGGFLGQVPDTTLQTAILEASLEADAMTFMTSRINSSVFQHARREYVTCVASNMLLANLVNGNLKSKTLADLSVQYDTNGIRDALNRVNHCMEKWLPQLQAGGGARAVKNPSYVVKGELDTDRPHVARSFEPTRSSYPYGRYPAANERTKTYYERRYKTTFRPKKQW